MGSRGFRTKKKIQVAHFEAIKEALLLLEEKAAMTRRGSGGSIHEKVEGLIAATFEHSTNRSQQVHLHHHLIIANLAMRSDQSWGTIESRYLMQWQKAAGSIYRAKLAEGIRSLGFSLKAENESFHVSCIPKVICDEFSKRSKDIKEYLFDKGISNATAKQKQIAALSTREKKGHIDRPSLFKKWNQELKSLGLTYKQVIDSKNKASISSNIVLDIPSLDHESILQLATENKSTFREQDVYFHAGQIALQTNTKATTAKIIAAKTLLHSSSIELGTDAKRNKIYTTKEVIATEQELLAQVKRLDELSTYQLDHSVINHFLETASFTISEEQKEAVWSVCNESNIAIIQGSAGVGKTLTSSCVTTIYQQHGHKVHGAAIAKSAANNLADETGIPCHTIAKLLISLDSRKPYLNKDDVLIVDEAGQIGTFQLNELLFFADKIGFKVILVGEDKQLDAIRHGGVLRYLSSNNIIGTSRIETIRRQAELWDRQAVADFRDGYAHRALVQYDKRGQLKFSDTPEETKCAVIASWKQFRAESSDKQYLVIAHRWSDVSDLNQRMRKVLQEEGIVGNENIKISGTVSNKDIDFELSIGERVRFTKNDYDFNFTNGDTGTVTGIDKLDENDLVITIMRDNGRRAKVRTSLYCNDEGKIYLTSAYAQTIYSSQGLTVNGDVFIYHTPGMDRANTYVACSRHKNKAHLFASTCELEDYIPLNYVHAPKDVGIRAALAEQMSWDERPKLAIEYLETYEKHLSKKTTKIEIKQELNIQHTI